ncbi:MAG: hypothetical protein H5T44_05205 [Thermoplasmatales archaeon]|nr:hypothetical protein [Thermoplasmatales archaeon]
MATIASFYFQKVESILSVINFSISFIGPEGSEEIVDFNPFAFRIPWVYGTKIIQIRNAKGNVLAEKIVSENSPVVTVVYPNGGEEIYPGNCTIRWNAYDIDGDKLTFDVMLSADNGENWIPIGMDIKENAYTCNMRCCKHCTGYIRCTI